MENARKSHIKEDHVKEEQMVMICPKCKSPEIERDRSNPLQGALGMSSMFNCLDCGFSGYAFPEVPASELKGFEKAAKEEGIVHTHENKTKKVDTRYGNFAVSVWWKIISPALLVLGAIALFNRRYEGLLYLFAGMILFYFAYMRRPSR
jgi:predicted RNA-binding Zn-ribbon protein involved in translation (DUF1610 family)